jgi:TRAP-type C4-dicarboxylate transport system permease small subunit
MTDADREASKDGQPSAEGPSAEGSTDERADDLADELVERLTGDETDAPHAGYGNAVPEPGEVAPPEYGRLDRGFKTFSRWMSYLGAGALAVITIVCFIDVVGSKLSLGGIPSQFDLIANLNLVMVFMAAFYVQMDRGSVSIELAQDHFPRLVKLAVRVFGDLLGAGVSFFVAYRGFYYLADFWESHKSAAGVWHFPVWPFQAVLVFGSVCLGLAFLFAIARDITDCRLRRGKYAPRPEKRAASVAAE